MNFDMNRIGSPEEFQIRFFTTSTVGNLTGKPYTLTDVIPWIEVPTPIISLSLEPEISKVYPQQQPISEKIIINSTSKITHKVQLHPQNKICPVGLDGDYCWEFERLGAILIPPSNLDSVPVTLKINNMSKISHDFVLRAVDFQFEGAGISHKSSDITKVWHIRVGDFWPDLLQGVLDIPNKYPYIIGIISSTGSFFLGFFVSKNQKPIHSKIRKLLNRK